MRDDLSIRILADGPNDVTMNKKLAAIEYHGVAGSSHDCQNAVMRLLQFGDSIVRARILTYSNTHALLLTNGIGDSIAIKSGFSSGYGGAGPMALSYVLQLLDAHGTQMDECIVAEALIERLDRSALTIADTRSIETAEPVRPNRWRDYVRGQHIDSQQQGSFWQEFPPVIPYAIVDSRIADLALGFWQSPNDKILAAYKRLEDVVRRRTGLREHGVKLFSKAFSGESAHLYWDDIDEGEKTGRANLFTGAYMAHRNPQAHREMKNHAPQQLAEFLLLNHLYQLEKDSLIASKKIYPKEDGLSPGLPARPSHARP